MSHIRLATHEDRTNKNGRVAPSQATLNLESFGGAAKTSNTEPGSSVTQDFAIDLQAIALVLFVIAEEVLIAQTPKFKGWASQVLTILQLGATEGFAVVPVGGRTNVTSATQCPDKSEELSAGIQKIR